MLCLVLLFWACTCFSQTEEKNGTIYIKHPYIEVVKKTAEAYLKKDMAANMQLYADTALFWSSGMEKPIPIKDAFAMWLTDFDYYDDIEYKEVGYPDYLHYVDNDTRMVQSWWEWSGKSKKTNEQVVIQIVVFDTFNTAGKIIHELIYGDFSKMIKE